MFNIGQGEQGVGFASKVDGLWLFRPHDIIDLLREVWILSYGLCSGMRQGGQSGRLRGILGLRRETATRLAVLIVYSISVEDWHMLEWVGLTQPGAVWNGEVDCQPFRRGMGVGRLDGGVLANALI
jgi:hypothetical protein